MAIVAVYPGNLGQNRNPKEGLRCSRLYGGSRMKIEEVMTRLGRKSFPALRSAAFRPATFLWVAALAFAAASPWAQTPEAQSAVARGDDVYFVQLSDTHWGFNNPKINPDFAGTLKKAIV